MVNSRVCKLCNNKFIPKNGRQLYCKKSIKKICPVCGDEYNVVCSPNQPVTCSKSECKKKAGYYGSINVTRICDICGSEFKPISSTQKCCNKEARKICEVCGKEFTIKCTYQEYKKRTCSDYCKDKLASINRQKSYMKKIRICELCGKEFHPRSNTQKVCEGKHFSRCIVCGKEFELNYRSNIGQVDLRKTCSDECFRKLYKGNNPFSNPESLEKYKNTSIERYGTPFPMQSEEVRNKVFASYKDRTGYDHPSHNPNTYKGRNIKVSSLELKVSNALSNNRVNFEIQQQVSKGNIHHKFDFYLPEYNMYIDVDGEYYHGYLDDSNRDQVSEDRDDARLALIEPSEIFVVITEQGINQQIDNLLSQLRSMDSDMFDYSEYMFNWCRSIDFPYPVYNEQRLKRDYANLCKYDKWPYNSYAKLGLSSIRHFHKSIYDARVGNNKSIKEAWEDDNILRKVIHNRMIYRNDADPSKILAGFYISKIVPKVSIFNPVLARYITLKYLNDFTEVADPFSGFSGRLLGVTSTGKYYFGSDLNQSAVSESNDIIKFHNLNADIIHKDVMTLSDDSIKCQCLLTCPPYSTKETYGQETEYRTCDEWIDLVLQKYNCKRYVFVVDKVNRYASNVVEDLITRSYFSDVTEKVVLIDK